MSNFEIKDEYEGCDKHTYNPSVKPTVNNSELFFQV